MVNEAFIDVCPSLSAIPAEYAGPVRLDETNSQGRPDSELARLRR
jgi:hypothetical protein